MEAKTLFDKIWDAHVVQKVEGGPNVFYIDRHFIHEVTSPVAFLGLKNRGLKVFRPENTTATPDHNVIFLKRIVFIAGRDFDPCIHIYEQE